MKTKLSKLDIITETQEAYPHTFNRAVDDYYSSTALCYYIDQEESKAGGKHYNGAMCAVGRCLLCPENAAYFVYRLDRTTEGGLDSLLKEQYQGHCLDFWSELQQFHDRGDHFEDGGLSVKGLVYLSELRTKWEGK